MYVHMYVRTLLSINAPVTLHFIALLQVPSIFSFLLSNRTPVITNDGPTDDDDLPPPTRAYEVSMWLHDKGMTPLVHLLSDNDYITEAGASQLVHECGEWSFDIGQFQAGVIEPIPPSTFIIAIVPSSWQQCK